MCKNIYWFADEEIGKVEKAEFFIMKVKSGLKPRKFRRMKPRKNVTVYVSFTA